MKNKCLILISTYNGEKYLRELLNSVLLQKNVDILIRDDGSQDETLKILEEYSKKNNNLKYYAEGNIGYAKSFWNLLKKDNTYKYYAFCDQDDVWQKDKIEEAVKKIDEIEDDAIPVLYTSNVIAINNSLNVIKDHLFEYNKVINKYESFQKSILPGCTFVFNNIARDILSEYDGYLESHDWAAYAIINVFGKIVYDKNSYIYYRIHENNTLGKKNIIQSNIGKIGRFFKKSKHTRSKFAKDFYETYKYRIPVELDYDIKCLAYYRTNLKYKYKLILNRNYRGIIFKLYVILNRI